MGVEREPHKRLALTGDHETVAFSFVAIWCSPRLSRSSMGPLYLQLESPVMKLHQLNETFLYRDRKLTNITLFSALLRQSPTYLLTAQYFSIESEVCENQEDLGGHYRGKN